MADQRARPLCELVVDDKFYHEVEARLEDPDERDRDGKTLLHLAAWSLTNNPKIFRLLLERGADANAATPFGYTPLHFAVCVRKRSRIAALLDAGAKVNASDSRGRSALHFAILMELPGSSSLILRVGYDWWTVQKLLDHPEIDPNPVTRRGETPLLWATREKNFDAFRALLKKGADPNIAGNDRRTPLHVALSHPEPSHTMVRLLLSNGAGIYCRDSSRETPVGMLVRFIEGAPDDQSLAFASRCVKLVALRYRIRPALKRAAEGVPWLRIFLDELCREVGLMGVVRVHAKITLHDFALGLFQERVQNPVWTIYTPLVEALLTGLFKNYFECILLNVSARDLRRVLERTVGLRTAAELAPKDSTILDTFEAIRRYYDGNEVLSDRVHRYREFLLTKM